MKFLIVVVLVVLITCEDKFVLHNPLCYLCVVKCTFRKEINNFTLKLMTVC
jgi:hypothetical protein